MRVNRVVVVSALAFVVGAAGCGEPGAHMLPGAPAAPPAAPPRSPAPVTPDLGTVMERFYQQIEGAHWPFAYAMLSPRYRATIGQERFVARSDTCGDLDVALRQYGDRVVVATIGAKQRGAPARARRFEE